MRYIFSIILLLSLSLNNSAQSNKITLENDFSGTRLIVDGNPFMINGMNWDYIPIGENYSFNLWGKSDEFIKKALEDEMSLLKKMGVNAIRVYVGIPKKWIEYIYRKYGIYTMLNHSFGRYGLSINGVWTPITDYSRKSTKEVLLKEVTDLITEYKDTPGLLLFLLGNENNYGLFWQGAETEDFPDDEKTKRMLGEKRGRPMYKLFNEAVLKMKAISTNHPIAICNGDLLFLDMIADECPDIDILGTNMYRGKSFGDAFVRVKNELNKPILFTEFGSDAFNAKSDSEDQQMQTFYLVNNWEEIYENAYGLGKVGNSLGGFTFQFSDGWWKTGQTIELSKHNTKATWVNKGYKKDFIDGEDNMNEEWFGVCAKEDIPNSEFYRLIPRQAYYALKKTHKLKIFKTDKDCLEKKFKKIKKKFTSK